MDIINRINELYIKTVNC